MARLRCYRRTSRSRNGDLTMMRFPPPSGRLRLMCLALAVSVFTAGCGPQNPNPAGNLPQRRIPNPPNFVVFLADGVGYGDLGCFGQKRIVTPNLDRLAKQGLRMTEFYAGDPTGAATAWCLMTGYDTARAGKEEETRFSLVADHATMFEVLAAAGYETGFVGAWTLGDTENLLPERGVLESAAIMPGENAGEFPAAILRNGAEEAVPENADGQQQLHVTDLVARETAAFLQRRQSGNPFFLFVKLELPQGTKSAPSLRQYEGQDWTETQKAYAARISEFDRAMGMILGQLQEQQLANRTTVVFTSDSGPPADDEGTIEFFGSTGVLRGHRDSLYEGGIRVPCIARSPGQFMTDIERDDPAAAWDLLPTFIELSGAVRVPRTLDGVSVAPLLRGGIGNVRDMLYWENREEEGLAQAVRMEKWKVVRPAGKMEREACELYDLKKDPGETKNVAKDHPDVVARFLR